MDNVLVTGGAGFIGCNFIRYLQEQCPQSKIINLDALTYAGSTENLTDLPSPERYTFVEGDICQYSTIEKIFQEHKIDTVVHFAAESHVDRSIHGPGQFIQTNIVGTFTLLEVARHFWITKKEEAPQNTRFHHVSTDEVFGSLEPEDPAFQETTSYDPSSPYSASKASSDHLVRAYSHTYGLPITITNCSNNYGPNQFPEKLIPLMIMNATQGKPLPLYGDGQQVRDWLYVEDHCEAIFCVITKGKLGETYNVGGDNQPSNREIVQSICRILDEYFPNSPSHPHKSLITFVKDRPGHDRRYAMNIDKIHQDLGWQPRESLESGLRKTIDWYLNNGSWLSKVSQDAGYEQWLQKNYKER